MKKSYLLFGILFFLLSCKKDEDSGPCSKSDFVGTYTGIYTCDGEDPVSDVDYKVEERSGEYYIVDNDGESYKMSISGCSFTVPETNLILLTVSGDGELDGKEITFNSKLSILTIPLNCTFVGTKQ